MSDMGTHIEHFGADVVLALMVEAATTANGHGERQPHYPDCGWEYVACDDPTVDWDHAACDCGWRSDTFSATTGERRADFEAHLNERYLAEPIPVGFIGPCSHSTYRAARDRAHDGCRVPPSLDVFYAEQGAATESRP